VGGGYDFAFDIGGFPSPTSTVTSGALPTGLTLNTFTAGISGTPTVAGRFPVTVTATTSSSWDGYTATAAQDAVITINPATTGQVTVATPPASVKPGGWESDNQIRVFGETYNHVLTAPLAVGGKTIPAGTKVNSFYVHADKIGAVDTAHTYTGSVSFGSKILAIATTTADLQATTPRLGAAGVTYSTSTDQGLEHNDIAGTGTTVGKINLTLTVYNTSDAIRVITLAP
jgi:hypothetical protein